MLSNRAIKDETYSSGAILKDQAWLRMLGGGVQNLLVVGHVDARNELGLV